MQNTGYMLIKRKIQNRQNLDHLLSMVKQVPPASARDAFRSAMEALVADELPWHPDIDVKVSLTSCISEVMRITAPNQPYDDGRLKANTTHTAFFVQIRSQTGFQSLL